MAAGLFVLAPANRFRSVKPRISAEARDRHMPDCSPLLKSLCQQSPIEWAYLRSNFEKHIISHNGSYYCISVTVFQGN